MMPVDGTPRPMTDPAPPRRPPAFPVAVTGPVVLGAVLWTASALFFVAQAAGQLASTAPYSLATNLISDLGNTACGPDICSPLHALVDAAFIVAGACHAIGAAATYRAWPRGSSGAGLSLLAIAGVGLAVAGLVPENVGPGAHAAGALIGLVCLNAGMVVLGWSIRSLARGLGRLSQGAGTVGFVGTGYFLAGAGPPGVAERIADYPGAAMIVVLGVYLLVAAASRRSTTREAG
jgi:hypothetical membrane protein